MTLLQRGLNFIRYRVIPPHNMFTHKAEKFYYEEYIRVIAPWFIRGNSLLDIGCQNGRFTIPAARAGMTVTATDIKSSFFRYIRGKINDGENVTFRKESIERSYKELTPASFGVVMCLELLYNLPDTETHLHGLASLMKSNGVMITSHRTKGYYVYRFIRERNFKAASMILAGKHPYYNAQTPDELIHLYNTAGLQIKSIVPIGMFSGFGKDTFSGISNPEKLKTEDRENLIKFETDPVLFNLFGNNARYWLVIAQKR